MRDVSNDYSVRYHPEAVGDVASLDPSLANLVKKVIETRIAKAPLLYGKHLRSAPSGTYKIHMRHLRIVYRVDEQRKTVLIIAVDERRDQEVYQLAMQRIRKLFGHA